VEQHLQLTTSLKTLRDQMQQMISLDKVKQMQQQLSDLVELTGELQKELIHNLIARRDALLLPESALQEDKNLGVLLRPTEGLRVMPVATAAFPVLRPAAKHADKDCTAQLFFAKVCSPDTFVWCDTFVSDTFVWGRHSQRRDVCRAFWSGGWQAR